MSAFASSALSPAPLPAAVNWLVVDFDGTCTLRDTTPLLPKLAATFSLDGDSQRLRTFQALEDDFLARHLEASVALFADADDDASAVLDLDDVLERLDAVSQSVTDDVSTSGVLAGLPVTADDMSVTLERAPDLREALELRAGCVEALDHALAVGWRIGVLSVNWCPLLIEHALAAAPPEGDATGEHRRCALRGRVWSNAVDAATGVVEQRVGGAAAKKARVLVLRDEAAAAAAAGGERGGAATGRVVYVGDSATDLPALRAADVGVLIGGSSSAAQIASRCGLRLAPLAARRPGADGTDDADRDAVWRAESWAQIERLVLRSPPNARDTDLSSSLPPGDARVNDNDADNEL